MTMIRTFSVWITLLCFLGVQAWNPPSRAVQQLRKQLATVAIVTACSLPCQALDPSIYSGDYADPFHPLCERHIRVEEGSNVFHYSGTAVGPKDDSVKRGCSPFEIKQYGLRKGAFDGVILENGNISAGDGIHEGIWEPSDTVTTTLGYENVDGIRWNDGNKWTTKTESASTKAGKFITLAYIGVSALAGVKGISDKIQEKLAQE